jgi:hypothetical protein
VRLRAYLVSGEFRVHRDGCRDCEKEARRSDSAGHPEEYASRAEAIASLWSDIIAENPELYGTPGGLASLEAETVSCPAPAGCPAPARPLTAASRASRKSWPPGRPDSAWRPATWMTSSTTPAAGRHQR